MYQIQEDVDLWRSLIKAMGGALVPSKTFGHVIDFMWKDEDWSYTLIEDVPATLEMSNTKGTLHDVEQLEPNCTRRTL